MISVQQLANPQLLNLVPYEPGKPIEDVARELGLAPESIIKIASNENPLGPSPMAVKAMKEELEKTHLYPDGGAFRLRTEMAAHYGLKKENIILGCGSNEIIELLFFAFTKPEVHNVVVSRYAFAIYKLVAQLLNVKCIEVPDRNYAHDLDAMLAAITPETRIIFVASPNNPTGTRVSNEELEKFLEKVPDHVVIALDEAYYEFLDNPPDTLRHVKEGKKKVFLMRTFSKMHGLAGMRMGFGLGTVELIDFLQRSRQPFNTTTLGQVAALAGLKDTKHQEETLKVVNDGRLKMEAAFAQMGLSYIPSCANFVMVNVKDGKKAFDLLMRKGIIVRPLGGYGLPEFIRISVGTAEQVERILSELPLVLQEINPK